MSVCLSVYLSTYLSKPSHIRNQQPNPQLVTLRKGKVAFASTVFGIHSQLQTLVDFAYGTENAC